MTILRIDASARTHRSLTRDLADRFLAEWRTHRSDEQVIFRDVGTAPPPFLSETWIAAAFKPDHERTPAEAEALRQSDVLIDELSRADTLVLATPMYNYGMPAALKAWVDQVVRINKTFTFDLDRGDHPLEPVMTGKTLVLLTAHGEFEFQAGGLRERMNHLDPHIRTVAGYLGVSTMHHVAIEYQEFGDARHQQSLVSAQAQIPHLVAELVGQQPTKSTLTPAIGQEIPAV